MTRSRPADAALARLRSEIVRDRVVLDALADLVLNAAPALVGPHPERRDVSSVGLDLHRWYTGLEALVERVERAFATLPTAAERWHQELLEGACLDIAGVRPAPLPAEALTDLLDVLRFRHFLRHAYIVELDPRRLSEVIASLARARRLVARSLDAFDAFLARASTPA